MNGTNPDFRIAASSNIQLACGMCKPLIEIQLVSNALCIAFIIFINQVDLRMRIIIADIATFVKE